MTMREKIAIRIEMADENMFTSYETFADAALRAFAEPDKETLDCIEFALLSQKQGAYVDEIARAVCQAIAGMAGEE